MSEKAKAEGEGKQKHGRQGEGGGQPPRVLTQDEIDDVKKYAGVLTVEQLADYLMLSKPTFYAILERQPEVLLLYKKEQKKTLGLMGRGVIQDAFGIPAQYDDEGRIVRAEVPPNFAAKCFYLKTHGWKETVNVTADEGLDIGLTVKSGDERAKRARQALLDGYEAEFGEKPCESPKSPS